MDDRSLDRKNRAKIIATLGPASSDIETLKRLVIEGATIFRINLSHAQKEEVSDYVRLIRSLSETLIQPISIIGDLPGPKIRVHNLKQEISIEKGERITICRKNIQNINQELEKAVEINYPEIIEDINSGDGIYIDDGQIRLRVIQKEIDFLVCEAMNSGIIKPNKGINFPHSRVRIVFPTESDIDWIHYLCENDSCDYFALSYVRTVSDIEVVRELILQSNKKIGIISKIEKHEAIHNLDPIIMASDVVMVARGDLGIEMPIEDIPHIQKDIIHRCNRLGKPVITATQMLESMIHSQTPTRAEAADIANAVLDGTDALMLSAETAVSSDPIRVVRMMRRIIEKSESTVDPRRNWEDLASTVANDVSDAIAYSAARTANFSKASCIICLTSSGSTARRIAKYRPDVPIFVLTDSYKVCNLTELFWGTKPIMVPLTRNVQESIEIAQKFLLQNNLAKPGDRGVFTLGIPMGVSGSTNLIEVITF